MGFAFVTVRLRRLRPRAGDVPESDEVSEVDMVEGTLRVPDFGLGFLLPPLVMLLLVIPVGWPIIPITLAAISCSVDGAVLGIRCGIGAIPESPPIPGIMVPIPGMAVPIPGMPGMAAPIPGIPIIPGTSPGRRPCIMCGGAEVGAYDVGCVGGVERRGGVGRGWVVVEKEGGLVVAPGKEEGGWEGGGGWGGCGVGWATWAMVVGEL